MKCWSVLSLLTLLAHSHLLAAQTDISDLDAQRSVVVLIRSASANGTNETAAGLLVGQDKQSAYFITALHPLVPSGGIDPVTQVNLQFLNSPSFFPGTVFTSYSPSKDLAVIVLPLADLPSDLPKMPWKDPTAELPIHVIGHPPAASWTSWTGMVQNEKDYAGEAEWFTTGSDPSLAGGYSGGPVLDSHGNFIGIHLAGSNSAAKNLKSSVIVGALLAWHVPLTNLTSEDIDTARFRIAKEIVSDFRQDDVSAIRSHFTATINDQASNQAVRLPWVRAIGFLGDYDSVLSQTKRIVGPYTVYVTKVKFSRGNLELRLTFDTHNAIDTIWLIPVGDHPASQLETAARDTVSKLAAGQFQSIFDAYTDSIKAGNTPDTVAAAWNGTVAVKGPFMNEISAQKATEGDFVDVRCKFANGDVIVRVEFAPSLKLTGISYQAAP